MDGLDGMTLWKNLKERLSFKGLGCCGATWSTRATIRTIIEEEEDDEDEEQPIIFIQNRVSDQPLVTTATANAGQILVGNSTNATVTASGSRRMMNLGMALAAERNLRRSYVGPSKNAGPVKTLMRLIEETDGVDLRKNKKRKDTDVEHGKEIDWVCCVCMERNKGAAFIPCGHAFCRICSWEMWANRGCCPICNRPIVEILDIF